MINVSVIVPAYNVGHYIVKCIESVLNQTLNGVELIIVDDGSTDDCPTIIDNFASMNPEIRVVHKVNEGVTIARNTGLALAQGKYVLFLDADDYLEKNALDIMYLKAEQTNADWIVGDYYIEYPDGKRIKKTFQDFGSVDNMGFLNYCYSNPDFYYTGRLIRRLFLLTTKVIIPQEITYGEDNLAVTQYASHVNIAAKVNVFVLNYVQRERSVTNMLSPRDLQMRARAVSFCHDYLQSIPCYDKIKPVSDNYFINELCSFIARGSYDKQLAFILHDCNSVGVRSMKIKIIYMLTKISPQLAISCYKRVRRLSRIFNKKQYNIH